jgi:pyridoxal/pyridoxine/pyridoxamine kinase
LLPAVELRAIYLAISYLKLKVKLYKTVILSVLYGYGSWFPTLRLFANRMLSRMFVHKRQALTGGYKEF